MLMFLLASACTIICIRGAIAWAKLAMMQLDKLSAAGRQQSLTKKEMED